VAAEKPGQVALHFFRAWPDSLTSCPGLHSSLQSLETSFVLLAMGRFPHALVTCASAHESALKSAPNVRLPRSLNAAELYDRVVAVYPALATSSDNELTPFRKARNTYVHEGFTPQDNAVAAELLLKTGLPFLRACYNHLFSYEILDGLLVEVGEQLRIALDVYQAAQSIPKLDFGYCFSAFGHLIRWSAGQSQLAAWAHEASTRAEETGAKFETCEAQKGELERIFGAAWFFDCPICDECDMLVVELDEAGLEGGRIELKRAACPSCHLIVRKDSPFLADALCQPQIVEARGRILREFGVQQRTAQHGLNPCVA
jgi:hypothetical protein